MKLTMFSVYDSKAEAYIQPFFELNSACGLRAFKQACDQPGSKFQTDPGDYTLFELAEFDQDKGSLEIHKTPINHGLALLFHNVEGAV